MNSILIADEYPAIERRSAPGYFWVGFWTALGSIAAGALVVLACWAWLGFLGYQLLSRLLH